MTVSELKRWLRRQGCTFEEGTKHTIIRLGKLRTSLPRHPTQEVKPGTLNDILKDLGLK